MRNLQHRHDISAQRRIVPVVLQHAPFRRYDGLLPVAADVYASGGRIVHVVEFDGEIEQIPVVRSVPVFLHDPDNHDNGRNGDYNSDRCPRYDEKE